MGLPGNPLLLLQPVRFTQQQVCCTTDVEMPVAPATADSAASCLFTRRDAPLPKADAASLDLGPP